MASAIRILHLITSLNTGGAEMALLRLLSGINQQDFETQVVCMIPIGPVGEKIRALGIPVLSLEMPPGKPTLRGFFQLMHILKQFKPAILQTWLYHADLLGLFVGKLTGIRTIVWNIRSAYMDFTQYGRLSGLVVKICAFLSKYPSAIIVNSRAGQTVHTQLGYHPKEWIFIPNGIDTTYFKPDSGARNRIRREWDIPDDEVLIGIVGRFDPMKDHPTFLKAAAAVQANYPQACFVCVGDGPAAYLEHLKQLAGQLKLARILWPGPYADMPAIYNALDMLVLSSLGEGFPNVVAEAMACQKPCVVTDVGDAALLTAGTGLSVKPGDPDALATAIMQTLKLPEEQRHHLGKMAREFIETNFSLAQMVNTYTNAYKTLM